MSIFVGADGRSVDLVEHTDSLNYLIALLDMRTTSFLTLALFTLLLKLDLFLI